MLSQEIMYFLLKFCINVLAISVPLALFEIALEKPSTGWGSSFPKRVWYSKPLPKNNPTLRLIYRIQDVPFYLTYHLVVYGVLVPAVLFSEFFILNLSLLYLFSIYVTITWVQDLLWFFLNWKFDALRELLKGPEGNIWWRKKWVKITPKKYLPSVYVRGVILTVILLLLAKTME